MPSRPEPAVKTFRPYQLGSLPRAFGARDLSGTSDQYVRQVAVRLQQLRWRQRSRVASAPLPGSTNLELLGIESAATTDAPEVGVSECAAPQLGRLVASAHEP